MRPRRSGDHDWVPPFHATGVSDATPGVRRLGSDYDVVRPGDDKDLAIEVASIANSGRLLPTPGRAHQGNVASYLTGNEENARFRRRPAPTPPEPARALVRYRGFVDSIDGDLATIRLTDDQGTKFSGQYSASELAAAGVGERDPFFLTTVKRGGAVSFEIRPAPRLRLSPEQQAAIYRRIEREFADFGLEDDY